MESDFVGKDIIMFNSLESTNEYCKEMLNNREIPEGTVISARWQSEGKGQGDNSWESSAGENLTFSIILHPLFLNISDQFFISMITSLGIADFLRQFTNNVLIKWPNDIFIGNKKIAGILIENSVMDNKITDSIVGIGININQVSFGSHIPNAISLRSIVPEPPPLDNCLESLCKNIDHWYSMLKQDRKEDIKTKYTDRLFRLNQQHLYRERNKIFKGTVTGVDNFGRLALRTQAGRTRYFGLNEVDFL